MSQTDPTQGLRKLGGNEVVVLDDPDGAWTIESGSMALFSVLFDPQAGSRRFMFRCGSGEVLLGFPPMNGEPRTSVLALALEPTELRPGSRAALARPEHGARLENWTRRWSERVPEIEAPVDARELSRFHRQILEHLHEQELQRRREEEATLAQRRRQSRETAQQALDVLTSVLEAAEPPPPRGSDLFMAAAAIGRVQGIRFREPASWESSHIDPVEVIANASHVRTRQVVLHDGWWRRASGPLLGFATEERRPVALLPGKDGGYVCFDPRSGEQMSVDSDVSATLEPQAHVFYAPLPDEAGRGIELLKFALHGRARDLLLILAAAACATLLGMFTPQATAMIVDNAIPDTNQRLLMQIGMGLLAASLGMGVFRLSQGLTMMRVEVLADTVTQSAVWDRLLKLQMSFFRRFSTGDLESRVTAVSDIRSYLGGTTMQTLFGAVIALLNLGLLIYYSPVLTLVAVVVAALSGAVTIATGVMILRRTRVILELKGRFFGLMVQLINGIAKLRVAAAEERAFARWAHEYARLLKLELGQRRIQDAVRVINIGVSTLSAIALFSIAAALIDPDQPGGLTTGTFLAFHVAYGVFVGAIVSLSNTVTDVMAIAILRERARPILETLPEVNERQTDPGRLEGRMALDHVVFQYEPEGPIILDHVSMEIAAGQFVAIVGPSGSGKSTLFRLMLGFETPVSGGLYYDGQDLAGLDVHAVRRQMGVVLQSGRINAGSLFENIVCGAQVPLNQAWEAAAASGFADDITDMPMGMHTVISEGGTNLSGGQRQRLLLTRALVHRPAILLLDEATSALDNKTQSIVSESLNRLHVTRLVIAHRLSTIRNADHIYVIDHGRIEQSGNFDELSGQEGLFHKLMARQMT